ncbi:MAG: hypothetical protein NTW62_03010 [Candidatus Nomurabacteria bacterium]|nr:hypothetical protein [Candidatus Nomurabacteria bacterium]
MEENITQKNSKFKSFMTDPLYVFVIQIALFIPMIYFVIAGAFSGNGTPAYILGTIESILIVWGFILFIMNIVKGTTKVGKKNYFASFILLATFCLGIWSVVNMVQSNKRADDYNQRQRDMARERDAIYYKNH